MTALLWTLIAFFSGAIPFSVLIGRLVLGRDIRTVGDGNPGGANVMRAGGKVWGGLAVFLDALKGAIPVGVAYGGAGLDGFSIVPVALAPLLGHACSPFLRFRGGKAVATTFGVWTGLTLWQGPVILGVWLLLCYYLLDVDGWAVLLMMLGFLPYLLFTPTPPAFLLIWLGNVLLLAWKHRSDLRRRPGLRLNRATPDP